MKGNKNEGVFGTNYWDNPKVLFGKTYPADLKTGMGELYSLEKKIALLESIIIDEKIEEGKSFVISEMKKIGIEKLPYSYSALKSFIDPKTMNIHYNKHYKGYVKKLNNALSKRKGGDVELEDIIKSINKYGDDIRNNAGGAFNHALFWNMLSPKKTKISKELNDKIIKDFGSFNKFKTSFEDVAKGRFGSGWVWLIITKSKKLKVVSTPNQDNPLMNVVKEGGFPLLGLDLWEHSYYLKYQNKRDEYISNFWGVVNWDFVSKMYDVKTKTNLIESLSTKKILSESSEKGCTRQQEEFIRNIFNNNEQVKWTFRKGIDEILKNVYPDKWYGKNEYEPDSMAGIYDLERQGRSVINKLNTNYTGFCILLVDVNKVLTALNKPTIKLSNLKPIEQIGETKKFIKVIDHFKERIFDENSSTFNKIMSALSIRDTWGEQRENLTVERLKRKFGKDNANKIGGLGSEIDAIPGIDAEIFINGKKHTAQIKPFSKILEIDGEITVYNAGSVKKYSTDWLIFTNKKETLIFDNKDVKIVGGDYVIKSENLLYILN